MALIELRDVGKRFANGTTALEGLSLDIGEGEFVSLLGPSGCGKSTALRLMAGLESPTQGRVTGPGPLRPHAKAIGDAPRPAMDDTPAARSTGAESAPDSPIGFVFQEPTLMPWATVAANVSLPLRLAGRPRAQIAGRVAQALQMVGLEAFAEVYPRELSGGMKMRVSIARAMVMQPRLLLMDEPFAALDEMTRLALNDQVLALWRNHGLTVVFVTHSVYESVYLSSRIVVMAARPGRAVAEFGIDEPYPRNEDFRNTARYGEYCRAISRSLREHGAARPLGRLDA